MAQPAKVDDFPVTEYEDKKKKPVTFSMYSETFQTMLSQVVPCMSREENRPALCGTHMVFNGPQVRMVATDGHRLTYITAPALSDKTIKYKGEDIIINGVGMRLLTRIYKKGTSDIFVAIHPNYLSFSWLDKLTGAVYLLVSRRIEGPYVNYQEVVPQHDSGFICETADLKQTLNMAMSGNRDVRILVEKSKDSDEVEAFLEAVPPKDGMDSGGISEPYRVTLPIAYSKARQNHEVRVNGHYFKDLIGHCSDDKGIEIKMDGPVAAITLEEVHPPNVRTLPPTHDPMALSILMPQRDDS